MRRALYAVLLLAAVLLAGGCQKEHCIRHYVAVVTSDSGEDKYKVASAKEMIIEYLGTIGCSVGDAIRVRGETLEDCDRKMEEKFQGWLDRMDESEIDSIVENVGLNTYDFRLGVRFYDSGGETDIWLCYWDYRYSW